MKIIGISGTNGSGKDSLGHILQDDYGWMFISGSDILREELKRRKLPIERENLRELSAEWRRIYGRGIVVDKAFKMYEAEQEKYKGFVTSSLRNPGEAEEIHKIGGIVVWIDADPKVRYDRIYNRGRSAEDNKTFEQFKKEEYDEMHHHGGDEATLNMAGVKALADIFIENNSNSIEDFKKQIKHSLSEFI